MIHFKEGTPEPQRLPDYTKGELYHKFKETFKYLEPQVFELFVFGCLDHEY